LQLSYTFISTVLSGQNALSDFKWLFLAIFTITKYPMIHTFSQNKKHQDMKYSENYNLFSSNFFVCLLCLFPCSTWSCHCFFFAKSKSKTRHNF
jgi:hypothetical protein